MGMYITDGILSGTCMVCTMGPLPPLLTVQLTLARRVTVVSEFSGLHVSNYDQYPPYPPYAADSESLHGDAPA